MSMFERPEFNENGVKIVSEEDSDMMMDIKIFRMKKGDSLEFTDAKDETAILLTEGKVTYAWEGKKEPASRKNVFEEPPYCLHMSRGKKATITADEDSEIIVQKTENGKEFATKFYTPAENKIELMGATQWEGTAKREVLTVFDYQNAPYSNMVMGEVITKAGRWSSYIPHSHRQPEVYYFKFEKPQGFGAAFIGDNVFKSRDGSCIKIPGGLTHPMAAAPGYNMYYCWMIRHLPNDPWTTRDNDPDHVWLLDE